MKYNKSGENIVKPIEYKHSIRIRCKMCGNWQLVKKGTNCANQQNCSRHVER